MEATMANEDQNAAPENGPPPFWQEKAKRLVGSHLLVGKTYKDEQGAVAEFVQFHGTIEHAHERHGLAVRRHDTGEIEWLPPDLRAFKKARPGKYRLRSTGEVVVDPDYTAVWIIRRHG
jgi:hypothetical protein